MLLLPAFKGVLLTAVTWIGAATAAKPFRTTMTERELLSILNGPQDPELTLAGLSNEILAGLLDALYRNLDTAVPVPEAHIWYRMGLQESHRRNL